MNRIVHQHMGMAPAIVMIRGAAQRLQVAEPVAIIEKTWQPVIASLHDVLNTRERDAR